jgi:hypothetical protein
MIFSKTTLITACAALLLSGELAMADTPKASISKSGHSKMVMGSLGNTVRARSKTWHYGEANDQFVFQSNISIANYSGSTVYTTVEFSDMDISDDDVIYRNEVIDNITTNFQFEAVHLILRDSSHKVFFDGNVYPNTHFTIKRINTYITNGARATAGQSDLELVRN